jgi:hypothetical protein
LAASAAAVPELVRRVHGLRRSRSCWDDSAEVTAHWAGFIGKA